MDSVKLEISGIVMVSNVARHLLGQPGRGLPGSWMRCIGGPLYCGGGNRDLGGLTILFGETVGLAAAVIRAVGTQTSG